MAINQKKEVEKTIIINRRIKETEWKKRICTGIHARNKIIKIKKKKKLIKKYI